MRIYNLLILFILTTNIISDEETDCSMISKPTSKGDCNGKLSKNDKENKYAYCCYVTYSKKTEYNHCEPIEQKYYDNMSKLQKARKKEEEAEEIYREIFPEEYKKYEDLGDYSIDCKSNYLTIGIISLALFLI